MGWGAGPPEPRREERRRPRVRFAAPRPRGAAQRNNRSPAPIRHLLIAVSCHARRSPPTPQERVKELQTLMSEAQDVNDKIEERITSIQNLKLDDVPEVPAEDPTSAVAMG